MAGGPKRETPIFVRHLSDGLGVEVVGLDVRAALTEEAGSQFRRLCLEHSVLLLRGQELTLPEHVRFASFFGCVLDDPLRANFVRSVGALELHFDHWLVDGSPEPLGFTSLFAIEVAPAAEPTVFASVRRAHDLLPAKLKFCLEARAAVHVYDYSDRPAGDSRLRVRITDLPPGQPTATHPLLRAHPETGELTVYVSPRNTDHVVGLDPEESEALLADVFAHIADHRNLYVHEWAAGDLLIWDNHAVLHGRRSCGSQGGRRLRRLCVR